MSHRLLIGIRPPVAVRETLIDTMEALDGARWQGEEQLHLTLRFVGEVELPVAEDLAAGLASIAWPSFELALEGVSHFEHKGVPRAIWARARLTPELEGLRTRIERVCARTGLGRETRRFTPHITTGPINGVLAIEAALPIPTIRPRTSHSLNTQPNRLRI